MKIQNRVRIRSVVVMNQIADATALSAQRWPNGNRGENMLMRRLLGLLV